MDIVRVAAVGALLLTVAGCTRAETGTAEPSSSPPAIVIRPVDAQGRVQPGWTVNDAASAVDCESAKSSPYAVTTGVISGCGSEADGYGACWTTPNPYSAICLRLPINLNAKHLVRIDTQVTVAGEPAAQPAPIAIGLDDGRVCSIVPAAAWGPAGPPDFLCSSSPGLVGVWGGITKSKGGWTVEVKSDAGTSRHAVNAVYYVGIA